MSKTLFTIVGRPNVGKSTLFNRMVGRRSAIVEDESGVTRDRNYGSGSWNGRDFLLVDTGGIVPDAGENMLHEIERQAMLAVEESDTVLFLLDGREGLLPADRELARRLRATGKKTIFVVNKVDGPEQEESLSIFYELAPEELIGVSALHARGLDDLLDRLTDDLPEHPAGKAEDEIPRIAVVGRPNAGKSTLVNSLLGKERMIVSPVAGTTRDSVDSYGTSQGRKYLFIDTAGLRKKARMDTPVEYFSMVRTLRAIDRSDVALLLVDATEGFTEQDQKIAGLVHDAGKGVVILLNKWDISDRTEETLKDLSREIRNSAWFLRHAPILSISATTRQRISRIFPAVDRIVAERRKRISTGELNRFVESVQRTQAPPLYRNRTVRIQYITQTGASPPKFVIFANYPGGLPQSYLRYIERRLRENFGFEGTPIQLFLKKKSRNPKR